jgi:translocation and assembly module TamB
LVALLLILAAVVVALPWLAGTAPGRAILVGQVNAALAPGQIQLDGLDLSWFGPIELKGVTLHDPKGKAVLEASSVQIPRGLAHLIKNPVNLGTIAIQGAVVDVERRADGTIDLLDALARFLVTGDAPADPPPTQPGPVNTSDSPNLTVVLKGGKLRLASPELAEPIEAGTVDATVALGPGQSLELTVSLDHEGKLLEIQGSLAEANRKLNVVGKSWPLSFQKAGLVTRAYLDGTIAAVETGGSWTVSADAALVGVSGEGPALQGDRLALDRISIGCDASTHVDGWAIRKLEVASKVARLSASGALPLLDGKPSTLTASVDLAGLARMLPNALRIRDGLTIDRGAARLEGQITAHEGGERLVFKASLADLAATENGRPVAERAPVTLSGGVSRSNGTIRVEAIEARAAGVDVTAKGDLEQGVQMSGTIDFTAMMTQLRELLDLGGVDLAGQARLGADYRRVGESYQARFALEGDHLKLTGMTTEPIVRDRARLDASGSGPRTAQGLPSGWHVARLSAKAGDSHCELTATPGAEAISLEGSAVAMLSSPVEGRGEAAVKVAWSGRACEVDDLRLAFHPAAGQAGPGPLAFGLKGHVDLDAAEARLEPLAGVASGPIRLGAEGVKASGWNAAGRLRVEAALAGDLAETDRWVAALSSTPPRGLGGLWTSKASVTPLEEGAMGFQGSIAIANLVTPSPLGPVALGVEGSYAPGIDRLVVAGLDLGTDFGHLNVEGLIREVQARRLAEFKGRFEPSWKTLDPLIARSVEPSAKVVAAVRPFWIRGALQGNTLPELLSYLEGEIGVDLTSAEAFGVKVGPTPVVLKLGNARGIFDPIRTTLNDGATLIQARLLLEGPDGLGIALDPGTKIDGAAINDAVSSSVLAFVAPVLSQATAVSGRLSLAIDRGHVPITGTVPLELFGTLSLQDLAFRPGPMAAQVVGLSGRSAPGLTLQETLQVAVANGRVRQQGLSIPLGRDAKVGIDGSVGFDETLDLRADVPILARMITGDERLAKLVGTPRVVVPIRGTLKKPLIDRKALDVAIRQATQGLVEKGLKDEAGRLLDRVAGPNPGAKPASGAKPAKRKSALDALEDLGRDLIPPRNP